MHFWTPKKLFTRSLWIYLRSYVTGVAELAWRRGHSPINLDPIGAQKDSNFFLSMLLALLY